MRRRGFTLTELLVVGTLITLVGVAALPGAYAPRRALNEEHARGYLRMIRGAQVVWQEGSGAFQRIGYVVLQAPPRIDPQGPNLRLPLLPTGFLPYRDDDVGRRAGYRFESGYGPGAAPLGCWAWPETLGYAGDEVYWMEYATGVLYVVDHEPNWRELPALAVPDPASLKPWSRDD